MEKRKTLKRLTARRLIPERRVTKRLALLVALFLLISPAGFGAISMATELGFNPLTQGQKALSTRELAMPIEPLAYQPGEVLVKFDPETPGALKSEIATSAGVERTIKRLGPVRGKDIYLFKLKPQISVPESLKRFRGRSEVRYAEPNFIRRTFYTPNDPGLPNQWGLNNTGQAIGGTAGTPDADIDALEAWNIEKGLTSSVAVAVIDTGIDQGHPDLSSKVWQNTLETAGNGFDDDSNGYVDDTGGYNWAGIAQVSANLGWSFGRTDTYPRAQSIKGTGQPLTHVGLFLAKTGNPSANIIVSIRDSLGGADLRTATVYPSEVRTSWSEVYKALNSLITLTAGQTYYIVFRTTAANASSYYYVADNASTYFFYVPDPYRDGVELWWNGSTWISYPDDDWYFHTNPNASPRDDNGHGTHVSGIAGAATDNVAGVAGVSHGALVMSLKVFSSDGQAPSSDIIGAIYYAADNGARVMNMSFGAYSASQGEQEAINYARQAGALGLAAVGNDGGTTVIYPAGYANVVGVGATTNRDERAAFSNYNAYLDVSAPGQEVYSTMPTYPVGLNSYGYAQQYDFLSGTSMATPMAAGVAALVISQNPGYTAAQVQEVMEAAADDLGATGWDSSFGYGRVNAYEAVGGPAPTTSTTTTSTTTTTTTTTTSTTTTTATTTTTTTSTSTTTTMLSQNSTVDVYVRDTAAVGLAGAKVTLRSSGIRFVGYTDASGRVRFTAVPYGGYTLSASKKGYTTSSASVSVNEPIEVFTVILFRK